MNSLAKKILLAFLISVLILPILGINVKRANAAVNIGYITDPAEFQKCSSGGEATTDQGGLEVTLDPPTLTKTGDNQYQLSLAWTYTQPSESQITQKYGKNVTNFAWTYAQILHQQGIPGAPTNITESQTSTTFQTQLTPGTQVPLWLEVDFCWEVTKVENETHYIGVPPLPVQVPVEKYNQYKHDVYTQHYKINVPTDTNQLPTISNGAAPGTAPGGAGSGPESVTPGKECYDQCKISWIGRFSISDNIQYALCQLLCTLIDWESDLVTYVINHVLMPALGLGSK